MIIQISIDTETLETHVSIPSEFSKNHQIIWLIDKILGYELKGCLPKLQKEIDKAVDRHIKNRIE